MGAENELVKQSRTSIRAMVDLLRPPKGCLYIPDLSIQCLAAYISGWFWALNDRAADQDVWDNFLAFVAKRYRDQEHRSWDALILFHSPNSYRAYQDFFRYFDQSVEEMNPADRS